LDGDSFLTNKKAYNRKINHKYITEEGIVRMISFLIKVITILILSDGIADRVAFAGAGQAITFGIILAAIGTLMEYFILREGTLWVSVIMDFVVSAVVLYYVTNMLEGATMTLGAAVTISLVLGVIEYFVHRGLIRTGRVSST
jgi:uncharacterized membrane protein YvlD (DUF360 family)